MAQVPPELKEDLILIADKIEPYLLQVKEQADKIPEKAHELAGKIQPAAEKLGDQIEQGAAKVCLLAHPHMVERSWTAKANPQHDSGLLVCMLGF